jgi:hypothetical protein
MVVLSSCDLGLADVRPGDETFGMVTALLTAGAGTVVASVARPRGQRHGHPRCLFSRLPTGAA